jgi:signal transduction histidine kinase
MHACSSISWDKHGGTIEVDSREGEFTEFTIRLPRRAPLEPAKRAE